MEGACHEDCVLWNLNKQVSVDCLPTCLLYPDISLFILEQTMFSQSWQSWRSLKNQSRKKWANYRVIFINNMLGKEEIGWQLEECITAAEGAGREQQASRISLI